MFGAVGQNAADGSGARLRLRPAGHAARLRRGRRAAAEPRRGALAGRDPRHDPAVRAPADPDAREVERRERAAARPRGLRRAWLGRRGDRPRRPLDLARPRPARRLSDPRPARPRQGPAPLRARPRARAGARARPTSGSRPRRARAPNGSGSTPRPARSPRSASAPRAGSCVTASRSMSTATSPRSRSSTPAGWTCRSPRSAHDLERPFTVTDAREPVLRRLGEVLRLDVSALPVAAAS